MSIRAKNPEKTRKNMSYYLHCASCGRTVKGDINNDKIFTDKGIKWCTSCADIIKLPNGKIIVSLPSPGRMYNGSKDDLLNTWKDCFMMKVKKQIKVKKAKEEIQIAWEQWKQKKSDDMEMLVFFGWLTKHRPYFLTFRCNCDRWQKVHGWLLQYERQKTT